MCSNNRLASAFKKFGIDVFGVTSAKLYNREMKTNYKSALVALFPYYCGNDEKSLLSMYCRGKDYHIVIKEILNKVANELELQNYKIHSDIGPSVERKLAVDAGLCFVGKNSMCINKMYGSYFFIGYMVCGEEFAFSEPCTDMCLNCGKCIKACPGGALNDGFDEKKCLSAITQKKGTLEQFEQQLIKNNNYIFGCDICQKVCPHNENIICTSIEDFGKDLVIDLNENELKEMSNKEFKSKYGDRAFAWRGKNVLLRNIEIIKKDER